MVLSRNQQKHCITGCVADEPLQTCPSFERTAHVPVQELVGMKEPVPIEEEHLWHQRVMFGIESSGHLLKQVSNEMEYNSLLKNNYI